MVNSCGSADNSSGSYPYSFSRMYLTLIKLSSKHIHTFKHTHIQLFSPLTDGVTVRHSRVTQTTLVCPVLPGTAVRDEEPVHITWSSSESEQSESEAQQPTPSLGRREPCLCPQIPARTTAPIQSYSRALRMLNTGAGKFLQLVH